MSSNYVILFCLFLLEKGNLRMLYRENRGEKRGVKWEEQSKKKSLFIY